MIIAAILLFAGIIFFVPAPDVTLGSWMLSYTQLISCLLYLTATTVGVALLPSRWKKNKIRALAPALTSVIVFTIVVIAEDLRGRRLGQSVIWDDWISDGLPDDVEVVSDATDVIEAGSNKVTQGIGEELAEP